MNTRKSSKNILITSAFANEGKSWISSNLAVTFAQAGKKVLLIDADMRKGRQYSIFKISPIPGLSNYLSEVNIEDNMNLKEEIVKYIQKTEIENLYVMSAGNIPPNPSELLNSPQMFRLLEELQDLCDIVIIDGTPCQLVTDSLIISRMVESTILVTACKETKKEGLKRVIHNIENVGGKIAGVILNKVPVLAKKYEEAYYYSSSSKETSKYNDRKNLLYDLGKTRNALPDNYKVKEELLVSSNKKVDEK